MTKLDKVAVVLLAFVVVAPAYAAEPCKVIHGRAHFYGGDGRIRIWHIGTRHEYEPADETSGSRVLKWLEEGVKEPYKKSATPASSVYLFADFLVCPIEESRKGEVQRAQIKSASPRHYVSADQVRER